MVPKTRIKVHDLGPTRWHMTIWFPRSIPHGQFEEWIEENLPDCFCKWYINFGGDPYYEVRGGDPDDQLLIVMRWAE